MSHGENAGAGTPVEPVDEASQPASEALDEGTASEDVRAFEPADPLAFEPADPVEPGPEDLEDDLGDTGAGDAEDGDVGEDEPGVDADTSPGSGRTRLSAADLEQEGDIAADYVEGLLDIADLDGDIDMDVEADRAVVSVVGGTLDELVGPGGEVLEALQELTRLAVQRQTGERTRMMLDVGGYRSRRRAELTEVGRDAVGEVKQTGVPKRLAAMTAFERKVVHDAVAAAGLRSESEGEDPGRRVVVYPA